MELAAGKDLAQGANPHMRLHGYIFWEKYTKSGTSILKNWKGFKCSLFFNHTTFLVELLLDGRIHQE